MKKALAILLSVLLMLAAVPLGVLSATAANDPGVVENTNFDDGELHGWASGSTVSVEDGALKFECIYDWSTMYKYANGMKPNTEYLYTFKAKANKNTNMNIKINDNWSSDTARETVDLTTAWQEFSIVMNSGACTFPILMFSSNEPASAGVVYYIDDIVIAEYAEPETPVEPADGNRIVNGDFETGDASGWETWQSTTIEAAAAKDGAFGAHLVGNGGWGGLLNQTMTVEAGKEYKLSFWINVNAMGVNVQVKDGAYNSIEGAGGWFDYNKKDHLVEWTFTATDDKVLINFCGSGSAPEDAYVDNFSLVCLTADEPETPASSAIIEFTDKANRISYTTSQQVWAQNGITVTNDKGASTSNVGDYGGDGYPARFYKSSTVKIEYPAMKKIVIDCSGLDAKYVNGWADSFSANATASVENNIVTIVLAEAADAFVWETLSAQSRAYTITVYGEGGVVEPDVPVDPEPDEPETPVEPADSAMLDLTDKANRVSYSSSEQVWAQNGITVTNEKGASTANVGDYGNPARFYRSSTVKIEYPGMTKIVIDSVTYADIDYAIGWTNSFSADATATVVDGDVTIVLAEPADSFVWETLSAQSRAYYITVYTGDPGETPDTPDTPDEPDVPVVPDEPSVGVVDAPKAGVAYKFGMIQGNVSATDVYYLKGGMNGYYMDTATDVAAAIDVYLEETDDGYNLYAMVNGVKQYINMVVSGTHVNGAYGATASTVYTFDADAQTVIAEIDGAYYWFGTRNDKTYTTVGPCNVEFAGFYCQFYAVAGGDTPDTPDTPDEPSDDPAADSVLTIPQANELGLSKDKNTYTAGKYYVTGKIAAISNSMYGNMYIVNEDGNQFMVYGTYSADGSIRYDALEYIPVVGDTITVYGIIGTYNGTEAQMKNGWITEIIKGEGEPENTDPAADSVLSVQQAIDLGLSKLHNVFTENKYYVTAEITEIYNDIYGNMYVKDADGNILTIYGTYDAEGINRFDAMETKPVVGDIVKLYGIVGQYNGNAQMKNAWIIAINPTDEPETPAEPADDNLIVNGDFETGDLTGWEAWQSTIISTDAAKNGSFGAHLMGNGGWGGLLNQTMTVEAGKQYKLSFWINVIAMGVNVQVKDGSGKSIEGAGGWFDTKKKDYLVEWTFTATDNSVLINFCGSGSAPEDVYVDNISLVCLTEDEPEIPNEPSNDGYIINGDFETGDVAPWENLWDACPTVEVIEGGKDSKYALNIVSGQWKNVRQAGIAVEANTDYKITVWAKNTKNMCLLVEDGNDTQTITWLNMGISDEWTQFSIEFNSGSFTSIIFALLGSEVDAYGTFDNIVMEKVGGGETPDEPETPDVPSDAVLNATFGNNDLDGIQSSSTIYVADGVLIFNVNKDWGNIYTGFEVEANTDYQVTFRAQSNLNKNFWVKFHRDDWGGDICQETVSLNNDWAEYSCTLNTGDNTYVYLLIQYAGFSSDGEIAYFDYITVKKAGGDEPDQPIDPDVPVDGNLIINGGFENGDEGWETWQSTIISTDAAKNGSFGAHLMGNGGWGGLLNQTVIVEAGKEYKLSFWIDVNASYVNVLVRDSTAATLASGWFDTDKKDHFVEWTFTATDNTAFIYFCGSGTGQFENAYVDNFSLVCLSEPDEPEKPVVPGSIVNGGFENGSEGWELGSSASITDEDSHGGNYSLKLENPGMWSNAALQNVPVKPNTEYVIKVWTLRVSGSGAFNLFMMDTADYRNLEIVEGYNWFNTKDVDWTEHTIVINTGDASEIVLKWSSETSNAGILLIDDMTITEKNAPSDDNCVVNGDFETGDTTGWETWQSTIISTDAAKNGFYGAHLRGNGGWGGLLNQTFAVENGETYVITLWARVHSAGVNLQIKNANKIEGQCDSTYLDANELPGWTKRTFTVVANSNEMTLNFLGSGAGKAEDAYIDDIVVTKKGEVPPAEDTYPIKNAGFETGDLTGWNNLWGSCVVDIAAPGHGDSQYALDFYGPGAWNQVRQDGISVEPNTDYTLIAYTQYALNLLLVVKKGDDSGDIATYRIENDMSGTWVRHEISFNSGDETDICVLIISNENGYGSALVDDVQIYKKGEEPTEPDEPEAPMEGPMSLDSFGVAINRPASPEVNRIQNGSFEETLGGQWQSVISDTLYVVDDETAPDGNKSLFFNTSGVTENNKVIFYLDVEPNTDYVFSAWVKGAYISDDNRFNATFGVTDWKDNFCVYSDDLFSNKTRQIVPTAWDNQWHLRSVQFNSGANNRIGIGFAGAESQMWIDDIALYTVENGVKYDTAQQNAVIRPTVLSENEGVCSDEHNRIANATMDSAAAQEFWASAEGFKNGFISFPENEYEYGTSMKYVGDADSCCTHAIKWLELKPNTKYTFSVDIRVVKSGGGRLALLDGKPLNCCDFLVIDFDQYSYGVDWVNITIEFDSVAFDRIGIAIVDGGGEALIDNMRLFESAYRIEGGIDDEYIDPPYDFGDPEASASSAVIEFTDIANRVSYSTSQQVWRQNGVTIINNKGASTSNVGDYGGDGYPARFYKNSTVTIHYANITKIVIDCGNLESKYVEGWANSFSADATAIMNGTSVVIVLSKPADSFTWEMLSAQCRAYSITVYTDDAAVLLGDVNGDGKVNNRDVGLLQRYINAWNVDVFFASTDMNNDGRINNRDLGLLWQSLLQ